MSIDTMFERVRVINELAGNLETDDTKQWGKQFKLIRDELYEMLTHFGEADEDGNYPHATAELIRDDIQDVLFTTYGLAARMGFNADRDGVEVCSSNMSKFDTTSANALKTGEKYRDLGVHTYFRKVHYHGEDSYPIYYITYVLEDVTGTDGKHYPAGKWLKSVNFNEPDYASNISHFKPMCPFSGSDVVCVSRMAGPGER